MNDKERAFAGEADREMMRLAIEEARKALSKGEVPVGCIIAKDGHVIARAHNERESTHDASAHAELLAIRRAGEALGDWRLEGCTLYVTLEPCCMCAGAIAQSRISRVVYGARDNDRGCAGSVYRIPEDPALGGFCPCDGGVLEEECALLPARLFAPKRS